ncbi:MAG: DUF4430 domain-containing protein [Eggerthellaceae bacterium]|nr:DUF4430 domain-containing protein [Eggerthellaceae bacterium]
MLKKSLLASMLAALMLSGALFGCSQPAEQSNATSSDSAASVAAETMAVSVEIDPSAADGLVEGVAEARVPQDVDVATGASAYDALVATGAELEGTSSYVTSINGLAEKAAGPTYGWMYEVNGEIPSVAADEYELQPGDAVRWYYASYE